MIVVGGLRASCVALSLFIATTVVAGPLTPPPGPVQATDRVRINQQDIASFPYVINDSGSYVLTSNIVIPAGAEGIVIQVSGVTLDLNGFNVIGDFASLDGIRVGSPGKGGDVRDIAILNGIVRNCGGNGIDAINTTNIRVQGILSDANALRGIAVGSNSSVRDCLAIFSGDIGISTRNNSTVEGCTAMGNGSAGIFTDNSASIRGCASEFNTGDGIFTLSGSTIADCTSRFNFGLGISIISGCKITGCSVEASFGTGISGIENNHISDCAVSSCNAHGIEMFDRATIVRTSVLSSALNGIFINGGLVQDCNVRLNGGNGIDIFINQANIRGCDASNNRGDGILVRDLCTVINNNCAENGSFGGGITGAGINVMGDRCRIDGNHVASNDRGIEASSPIFRSIFIRNSAMGNTDNYGSIDLVNDIAPISSAALAASAWANIEF